MNSNYSSLDGLFSNVNQTGLDPESTLLRLGLEVRLIRKKMTVLPTAREMEALSELTFLKDMSAIMKSKNFQEVDEKISKNEKIEKLIFEDLFAGVCNDFLKTRIYTNKILVQTGDQMFTNLITFCTERIHQGRQSLFLIINTILDKNLDFYKNNGREANIVNCPFGTIIEPDPEMIHWIDKLQVGTQIDAMRCYSSKQIWSRAIFESQDYNYVRVRFYGETTSSYISNRYFDIRPFGSKSVDFDWRENLKKDDLIDYFNLKTGWILCRVTATSFEELVFGEKLKYVEIKKESDFSPDVSNSTSAASNNHGSYSGENTTMSYYYDDFNGTLKVKVHNPIIGKARTFSSKSLQQIDDSQDEFFLAQEQMKKFAILRPNINSAAASTYFVKYANTFGECGGFSILSKVCENDQIFNQDLFCESVYLIKTLADNLVQSYINENGQKFLSWLLQFAETNIDKNIRVYSQIYLSNFIDAVSTLSLRIFPLLKANLVSFDLIINIGIICLKSEILEKQFFGAKQILGIEPKLRDSAYDVLRKKLSMDLIRESIVDKVVKGHPSLISKSTGIFSVLFRDRIIRPEQLSLIWDRISKTDSESRSALAILIKEVSVDMSKEHIMQFLLMIADNLGEVSSDILDLFNTLKKVGLNRHEDFDIIPLVNDVIWKMLQSEREIKPEVCKELIKMFCQQVRNHQVELFIPQIITSFMSNQNRNRNLKLLIKLLKEPSLILANITPYLVQSKIVDICVSDLIAKLETFSRKKGTTATSVKIALKTTSTTDLKAVLGENASKSDTLSDLHREIKRIFKFLDFQIFPRTNSDEELFTFTHFVSVFDAIFRFSITEKIVKDWTIKYLKDFKNFAFIEKCKVFFNEKIADLLQEEKHDFFTYFVVIFKNVNLTEKKLVQKTVRFETGFSHTKKQFENIRVCSEHPNSFFGMAAIWSIYEKTTNKRLYSNLAKLLAKIYLAPEFGENENVSLYEQMKTFLSETALSMMKQNNMLAAQKASLLLIQIIRSEEAKLKPSLMSLSQLKETDKILIFFEKDSKYPKERYKVKMHENQTVSQFKEIVAAEYKMNFDLINLMRENGEKISTYDNFQTLEMMKIKENEVLIIQEADVPEIIEVNMIDYDKKDFSEQVKLVWKEIFDTFSTDGQMFPKDFAEFTCCATDKMTCSPNEERVRNVFFNHDPERTGFLDFERFIAFFRECSLSSREKYKIVRNNLMSLGYGCDFRLKNEKTNVNPANVQHLLRFKLSKDQQFYYSLLRFLNTVDSENRAKSDLKTDAALENNAEFIFRLFEILGPSTNDIQKALHDPKEFLLSDRSPFMFNYKMTLLHGLIFRNDFCRNLANLEIFFREKDYLEFLSKMINRDTCQTISLICKELAIGNCSDQKTLNIVPAILTLEKILKTHLSYRNPEFYIELKSFLMFFMKQKKKSSEKIISEETNMPQSPPIDPMNKILEKELLSAEDEQINFLKSNMSESQFNSVFINEFDFELLNQVLLDILRFVNTSNGEMAKNQKHLLKSAMFTLASSVQLNRDRFINIIRNDEFKMTMVQGLSHELVYIKIYYKNLYPLLASLFPDIQTKTEFLKNLISNIKPESSEEFSGLIDLSCMILTEIGELKAQSVEYADYIHKEFNFTKLFTEFKDRFIEHKSTETHSKEQEDQLLIGYLAFLEKILNADELVLEQIDVSTRQFLVFYIFNDCLFQITESGIDFSEVKCRSKRSRSLAFGLLEQILKNNTRLNIHFMVRCIVPLVKHFPVFQTSGQLNPEHDKKPFNGFLGLRNLGCVCYMIATLQQFYCTPVFRYGILMANDEIPQELKEIKGKQIDDNFFHQIQKMMAYLDFSERRDFSPFDFCLSYKDYSGQPLNVMVQQDADEFLKFMVDKIESSLKKSSILGVLNSVYLGKICNVIKCKGCGYIKTNEENFYNLSLEVKKMNHIGESFEKFIEPEIISDYTCDSCKNKCDISKRALLKSLPNVLFLSLKKMYFDLELLINVKIHTRYEFPMEINLRKYMYVAESPDPVDSSPEKTQKSSEQAPIKGEENSKMDEDFAYKLVGVVIHKGNAEYGHYVSLINANRNDPSRKENNQDKWYEFDDSRVTVFDMKKFDEECFGTTEDKEYSLNLMMSEPNNSKSAYLLVYDKIKKNEIVINFTEDSIKEKQFIISNLIDPANVIDNGSELRTGFYNLKQFIPDYYKAEINQDNKLLLLEQQLLSRTFINGMTSIFLNVDLSFDSTKTQTDFSQAELLKLNDKKAYSETILLNLPQFLGKILCVSSENGRIRELVVIIERALYFLSYFKIIRADLRVLIDEKIFNFFKDQIHLNYSPIINMITSNSDQWIQIGLSEYLVKVITATLRNFEITKLSNNLSDDYPLKQKTMTFVYQLVYTIGVLFSQLDGSLQMLRKNWRLFWIAFQLCEENPCILEFFAVNNLLNILVDLYMKVDCSRVSLLEKCLAPMLHLIHILYTYEISNEIANTIHKKHTENVRRLDLILKGAKEDYKFEAYEGIRKLVFIFCRNDKQMSELVVSCCLKSMINSNDSDLIGYLEIFRSMIFISDEHVIYRLRLIFGIARLAEGANTYQTTDENYTYGLGKDHSLKKAVWNYISPFGLEKSCLELIFSLKESHENYVMLMIYYLVELMLVNEAVFLYVLFSEPPNYLCGSFYDWFIVYCEHHLKYDSTYYSATKSEIHALYLNHLPEKLNALNKKLSNLIESNPKSTTNKKIFAVGTNPYIGYINYNSMEREHYDMRELWSAKQLYLIGRTIRCKLLEKIVLDEFEDDKLKLKIHLIKLAMTPSIPTGQSNLAFPSNVIMSDYSINQYAITTPSLIDFIDSKKTAKGSIEIEDAPIEAIFDDDVQENFPQRQKNKESKKSAVKNEQKDKADSAFLNVQYALRISVSNGMTSGCFMKMEIDGSKNNNFEEVELMIPIKGVKNNYLVHTVCLKNLDSNFEGLKIKVGFRKTANANIRFYTDEIKDDVRQVFEFNELKYN